MSDSRREGTAPLDGDGLRPPVIQTPETGSSAEDRPLASDSSMETEAPPSGTQDDGETDPTGPLPVVPQETLANDEPTGPIPIIREAAGSNPHESPIDFDSRTGSEALASTDANLSWAARTDVGLVRSHNEDSFFARSPLFGVCDGMGGHAAGEVASAIAVQSILDNAPEHADDAQLGAAVETANHAVIDGACIGAGKPGMGCTASCCLIEGHRMAVAHVGDSRIYLLRAGTLVRITHDHSYVEELVDAGQITPDEARVHPSRSIITRALGSDQDMYADRFSIDVERGDRVILCSDGLSSMVPDDDIESLSVSSATPSECVDTLVATALAEGGHDNVTVIVVDVLSDGREEERRRACGRAILGWGLAVVATLAVVGIVFGLFVSNSWFVGADGETVGIYQGIHGSILGIQFSRLDSATPVRLDKLPEATQHQLAEGVDVASAADAHKTVDAYARQISERQQKAEQTASGVQSEVSTAPASAATSDAPPIDATSLTTPASPAATQGASE